MKVLSLVIHSAPWGGQASRTALDFCQAALQAGHRIHRLFFFQDGTLNANGCCVPPQDEQNLVKNWQQLIQAHELDAVVCVASALKRGVLDAPEAQRYEKIGATLAEGFQLGGLGQWVEATRVSDRILSFGKP